VPMGSLRGSGEPLKKIHCFKTLSEAEGVINRWIDDYNHNRRHSSLGSMTPVEYHKSLRKLAAEFCFLSVGHYKKRKEFEIILCKKNYGFGLSPQKRDK